MIALIIIGVTIAVFSAGFLCYRFGFNDGYEEGRIDALLRFQKLMKQELNYIVQEEQAEEEEDD